MFTPSNPFLNRKPPLNIVLFMSTLSTYWGAEKDKVAEHVRILLKDRRAIVHHLGPLANNDLVTVACQLVRAQAIPTEVVELVNLI